VDDADVCSIQNHLMKANRQLIDVLSSSSWMQDHLQLIVML